MHAGGRAGRENSRLEESAVTGAAGRLLRRVRRGGVWPRLRAARAGRRVRWSPRGASGRRPGADTAPRGKAPASAAGRPGCCQCAHALIIPASAIRPGTGRRRPGPVKGRSVGRLRRAFAVAGGTRAEAADKIGPIERAVESPVPPYHVAQRCRLASAYGFPFFCSLCRSRAAGEAFVAADHRGKTDFAP